MEKQFIEGITIKEKKINGSNGEFKIMSVGIKVDDFVSQLQQIKKDSGWANIVIKQRREPSEKGATHYAEVDTWEPKGDGLNREMYQNQEPKQDINEDIPF